MNKKKKNQDCIIQLCVIELDSLFCLSWGNKIIAIQDKILYFPFLIQKPLSVQAVIYKPTCF